MCNPAKAFHHIIAIDVDRCVLLESSQMPISVLVSLAPNELSWVKENQFFFNAVYAFPDGNIECFLFHVIICAWTLINLLRNPKTIKINNYASKLGKY
jgi:hypothetical protein